MILPLGRPINVVIFVEVVTYVEYVQYILMVQPMSLFKGVCCCFGCRPVKNPVLSREGRCCSSNGSVIITEVAARQHRDGKSVLCTYCFLSFNTIPYSAVYYINLFLIYMIFFA